MFEKGEHFFDLDRVVRIGSHTSQNRLFVRIDEHYVKDDHRDSILRKHLGRCFLFLDGRADYIKTWDLKIKKQIDKTKNHDLIDWKLESRYESIITNYIRKNISFILIPNLNDNSLRKRLEGGLIATFAKEGRNSASVNWLGNNHPRSCVKNSGLWIVQGLRGKPLTEEEIQLIELKVLGLNP